MTAAIISNLRLGNLAAYPPSVLRNIFNANTLLRSASVPCDGRTRQTRAKVPGRSQRAQLVSSHIRTLSRWMCHTGAEGPHFVEIAQRKLPGAQVERLVVTGTALLRLRLRLR